MRRRERARARLHHVPEARVVQVRHVDHHAALLHGVHHLGAERRKPIGRIVARRDGVFAVPREREHFHARVGGRMQTIERTFDERSAFDRKHAGAFPAVDNATNVASVAHLLDKHRMLGELPLKEIAHGAENLPTPIGRHMVGDERREALAPGILGFRHAVERDMAIVARERRHARIGDRSVLLHEAGIGECLVQGEPVERVAMQVENIGRCGFKCHSCSPLLDAAERARCCSVQRSALVPHIGTFVQSSDMIVPFFSTAGFSKAMSPLAHPIPIHRRGHSFLSRFSLFWHKFAVVNDGGCLGKGFPYLSNSVNWGFAFSRTRWSSWNHSQPQICARKSFFGTKIRF